MDIASLGPTRPPSASGLTNDNNFLHRGEFCYHFYFNTCHNTDRPCDVQERNIVGVPEDSAERWSTLAFWHDEEQSSRSIESFISYPAS
jgi:hypothetical protein